MEESRIQMVSGWVGFSIFTSEAVLAICCLSYALVLIAGQNKKNKVSDILVMHLCGCELITVIFAYCHECLYNWKMIDHSDDSISMLLYTVFYVNVYQSVMLITLDRVLAVYLVFKYKVLVTKKKLVIVFFMLWLVSLTTGLVRYYTSVSRSTVWWFWNGAMIIVIVASYLYIVISVYRRRRAMKRNNAQCTVPQLKFQIPLFIVCSFVLTLLTPDLVLAVYPELYSIWFQVIWSLNWISDPLFYVIFIKLQHRKDHKNKIKGHKKPS